MALRVLHLVGSAASEFEAELSLLYARDCVAATADPDRYTVLLAHVSRGGSWRFPADLDAASIDAAPALPAGAAIAHLVSLAPDVVVPQMFDRSGMTAYRSLFEVLGIPLVGNTGAVMALGADKALARAVVAAAGVSVPRGEVLRPGQVSGLAPPAVVKPVDADNSVGVTLVTRPEQFGPALRAAFDHARAVLVEEFVPLGREVRCGVLERDGELVCLPLEEYAMDAATKPIRLAADKIARDAPGAAEGPAGAGAGLRLVAKDATRAWVVDLADPVTAAVHEAARACFTALGCRHHGLFDFRVDPAGRVWFLEAGLYCSFARQSVVSVMAAAAGIPLAELFAAQVAAATDPGVR